MKQILVLGAGRSASYLIHHLLEHGAEHDWFVTVGDYDVKLAQSRVGSHPCGTAIAFDVNDAEMRRTHIQKADLVINMLPPKYQYLVALDCVDYGRPMLSASYRDKRLMELDHEANRKGVLLLCEMGLDPGIDHMITMSLIDEARKRGGTIHSLKSYGGALPAPDSLTNPLKYYVTWNPRNVVMSGEHGALYLEDGKIKLVPFHNLFQQSWLVEVEGIGKMEVYPNRDSLTYQSNFDLSQARTVIRGTIRYPGWSETWLQIVRLGLPNEQLHIPNLAEMTYRQFVEIFVPSEVSGPDLEQSLANYLNINPTGSIMDNLRWLGLFSDEVIGQPCDTAAEVLIHLIQEKLRMPEQARDMVILLNEVEIVSARKQVKAQKIRVTLVEYGERGGFSAVARAVGLPLALAAQLTLQGQFPITGCHIPTHPVVYNPILTALEKHGLHFHRRITPSASPE